MGAPPGRLAVQIEVENHSADTPLHVWSSLSRVNYDAATQTLHIDLADTWGRMENNPDIEIISADPPRVPAQVVVQPGARETVTIEVPEVLNRIRTGTPGLGLQVDQVPVGPVRQVQVTVAYGDRPLQPRMSLPPEEIRAEIQGWGQRLETTVANTAQSAGQRGSRTKKE